MVEKIAMCNVIRCGSKQCQKNKNSFCYVCGEKLNDEVYLLIIF
jgi:hypothetical protein